MLTPEQIANVATLAKLNITDNTEEVSADLNKFLDLIDTLAVVETDDVEPMAHPFDGTQRLRVDNANSNIAREEFSNIAPEVSEGHYLVPKVL